MILNVALALLWLAALHRVQLAIESARLWRVAFAVAVTALAVALTVDAHGAWLTVVPHLDKLIDHAAATVAACAGLIYVQTLHHHEPPRRALALTVTGGLVATGLLTVTWALAPIHGSNDVFGDAADTEPMIAAHYLVFYLYVAYGAGAAALYSGGRLAGGQETDTTRVPSLALIGFGSGLGSCAMLLGAGSVVAGPVLTAQMQSAKEVLVPLAACVLAAGVLLLVAVSPAVVEVVTLHRRWLRLRSLWKRLTAMHPTVALNGRPTWPPREALRMREQRALVEIHDALARENVPTDVDTLEALGRALRRGERGPVPASTVLPASGDFTADLHTVLRLASAYDAAPR